MEHNDEDARLSTIFARQRDLYHLRAKSFDAVLRDAERAAGLRRRFGRRLIAAVTGFTLVGVTLAVVDTRVKEPRPDSEHTSNRPTQDSSNASPASPYLFATDFLLELPEVDRAQSSPQSTVPPNPVPPPDTNDSRIGSSNNETHADQ